MTTNIGSLEIKLLANMAELQKGMDSAKSLVGSTMKDIQKYLDEAKSAMFAFTGVLVGVKSFDAFKSIFDGAVETRVEMLRLSQQTGASVESLGAIAGVAKLTGSNIGDVGAAMNKLQKNLATSTEDSKGAAQAIEALGINFKSFVKESPDQQMLEVAKAMATFNDGSGKSAAAMMLFGKTGAQLLPMLKELAEKDTLVGKTTTDSALQAEHYEQNMLKLAKASSEWKRTMVDDLLPTLLDVTTAMVKARQEAGFLASVKAGVDALGNDLFDWQGNAERKGIKWISDDLESLKAQRDGITVDVLGMKDSLGKEIDQKTVQLAKAQADYFKLTNGAFGGGRGAVNPTLAKQDLDPQLGAKTPTVAKEVDEGLTLLNSLKTSYEALTKTEDEYDKVERQIAAFKKAATPDRKDEILGWAMLIQIEKEAEATKKQLIAYDVEQANKQADQNKILQDYVTAGNDARASIIAQTDALGLSSDELVRHNAMVQIDTVLKRAMVGATSETRQELEKLAATMKGGVSEALDALKAKQDALDGSWQHGAKDALDAYLKTANNVAGSMQNVFGNAFKGMEDALLNFTKTGKLDFSSLADSIISDLVRIQIQKSITGPLAAAASAAFGGFFADGGSPPVGLPSIVGEKGPELFIPSTAGTIVPNSALGGGTSNVTTNFTINAPNASAAVVGQIRAMMPSLIAENRKVVASVMEQYVNSRGRRLV
ncbi:MAG: hypothetical protein HXX19_13820 [Rhodoferax sp.]|nr:hypothetical protein [Rhodoferax sp.]